MIAALYIERDGCHFGLPDVDPCDEERDARKYTGPHAVVAHPPCERWGRYWFGGPSARVRRTLGDDGGCFAAAIAAVRRWGGVLEHPEGSQAWRAFSLRTPGKRGGWTRAGDEIGWTCCVEQGHYGHRARKATWLYAIGCDLPDLPLGKSSAGMRLDQGYRSKMERDAARAEGTLRTGRRLMSSEHAATPPAFRDVLLSMARSVERLKF